MPLVTPDLDRKVVACLEAKCGSLADAVLIVYAVDGGELHALGVRDLSSFGGPDVYIPEPRVRVVWERVAAYHECAEEAIASAGAESRALPLVLPPLPGGNQLALYTHGQLQAAVKSFEKGATVGDVHEERGMPQDDARRVRLMHEHGLLPLMHGKLVADKRVGSKGAKYALRYLDDSGSRWLDPNKELVRR